MKYLVSLLVISLALPNSFGLCPDGWTLFEGHCYVWFPWLQTDFFKASEMCHSVNSHILTIDSEREQKFITNYYSHVQNNIWVDDENSKYDDYFSEDDTTVSDDDNSQNCSVVHFLNKSKTKWVKSNCQYFNNVVCKARQQNLVDLLENFLKGIDEDVCQRIAQISRMSGKHRFPRHYLSHLTTKECEEGWYKFDEKCYKIVKENGVQAEAEAKCQEMGAHLASIHSKEENDFLIDLGKRFGKRYMWIGAVSTTNQVPINQFAWTDGNNMDYTNFPKGLIPFEEKSTFTCMQIGTTDDTWFYPHWYNYDCNYTGEMSFPCAKSL